MNDRMGIKMEMLETALEGAFERIQTIESQLAEWEKSRKPVVYVDEETCLISSHEADIEFIKRNEVSKV